MLWPVALSLEAASECTSIRRKYLADCIKAGSLEAHVVDGKMLIAVETLVQFVKWHPLAPNK